MILIQCDNCGKQVKPIEGVGIGLPTDTRDFRYDAENEMVIAVSISKPGTSDQFCKACMWKAIEEMTFRMSPNGQLWSKIWEEEDEPNQGGSNGEGEGVSELRPLDPMQESGSDAVAKWIEDIRRENLVRSGGRSPWPLRGQKGSAIYRAGRSILKAGTRSRQP